MDQHSTIIDRHMPSILLGMGLIGFAIGYWDIWTHTFEGDEFFYFDAIEAVSTPGDLFSMQAFGRPVADLIMWGMYQIFDRSPAPYHILLLILHLIAAHTVYVVARHFGINKTISLLACILFAVNVSHFRTVHWISCLGYPLALIFGLAAAKSIANRSYVKSLGLYALGILSHPGIAFAPLAAFVKTRPIHKKPLLTHAGVGVIITSSLTYLYEQSPQAKMFSPSIWTFFQKMVWYLGRSVTSFAYVFPDMQDIYTSDIISGIILLFLSLYLLYRRSFWAAWALFSVMPFATNSNWSYFSTGPSRHLYFVSITICLGVAGILNQCLKKNRMAGIAFTAILLTLCGYQLQIARAHTAYLESRGHIAHRDLRTGAERMAFAIHHASDLLPHDAVLNAGIIMLGEGMPLEKILDAVPQTPATDMLRGVYGIVQNDEETTRTKLLATAEATKTIPNLAINTAKALNNLATYYYGQQNYDQALKVAQLALSFAPDYKHAIGVFNASLKKLKNQNLQTDLITPENSQTK